jgi:hypothetical protein
MASSISSPNLSKQDSSSSTGSSARMNGLVDLGHHHAGSDGSNSSSSTTHSKSHQTKKGKLGNNTVNNSQIKPSTIMSLEDRDLIVIEETDIKESTSAASDVIIVDPPTVLSSPENEPLDLKDILGSSWPKEAGPSASILNSDYNSINGKERNGTITTYTRNKSPNPISHLLNSKVTEATGEAKANGSLKNAKHMVNRSTMASKLEAKFLKSREHFHPKINAHFAELLTVSF